MNPTLNSSHAPTSNLCQRETASHAGTPPPKKGALFTPQREQTDGGPGAASGFVGVQHLDNPVQDSHIDISCLVWWACSNEIRTYFAYLIINDARLVVNLTEPFFWYCNKAIRDPTTHSLVYCCFHCAWSCLVWLPWLEPSLPHTRIYIYKRSDE